MTRQFFLAIAFYIFLFIYFLKEHSSGRILTRNMNDEKCREEEMRISYEIYIMTFRPNVERRFLIDKKLLLLSSLLRQFQTWAKLPKTTFEWVCNLFDTMITKEISAEGDRKRKRRGRERMYHGRRQITNCARYKRESTRTTIPKLLIYFVGLLGGHLGNGSDGYQEKKGWGGGVGG